MLRPELLVLAVALLGPSVSTQLHPNSRVVRHANPSITSLVNDLRDRIYRVDEKLVDIRRSHESSLADLRNELVDEVRLALSEAVKKFTKTEQQATAQLKAEMQREAKKIATWQQKADAKLEEIATWQQRADAKLEEIANLTRLTSAGRQPDPDSQRALANATKAGREAAVSNLQRLLGYSNATNVTAETVLSEIADCVEAKKIAQLHAGFRPIKTRDLDVASSGEHIGAFPLQACGARCLLMGGSCRGFHVSTKGRCTLFTTATASWSEKSTAEVTVWVRRSGEKNCTTAAFPYSRGRSRYRIVDKRMSWTSARKACEASGGKLAQIASDAERRFVHQLIKTRDASVHYHVGLYQIPTAPEPRGGWVWYPSRDRFDLHSLWDAGEPGDYGSQDFGCVQTRSGYFHDIDESYNEGSVCECLLV